LVVEEDAEVPNCVGGFDAVFKRTRWVSQPDVGWALEAGVRVREEDYLSFVWFNSEAR
jgi:hypothetical protein